MAYKRSNITESRKDEKKKLIFETAAKVFAQKGYHATTVKDITDTANISVGTFYLYFKNKEDVFEKLYDQMEQIITDIKNYALKIETKDPSIKFANVVAASIWTYQNYKELAKILLIEAVGLNPRFEKKYADIMVKSCESMEATLRRLKDLGIIDVPDIKVAAVAQDGAFNHIITYWLRTDSNVDLKTYAYPLAIFSLQALKIDFNKEDIEASINETFKVLDKSANELIEFS